MYAYSSVIRTTITEYAASALAYEQWLKSNGLRRAKPKDMAPKRVVSRKKKYRLHIVWKQKDGDDLWVPLGRYSSLINIYKKISTYRAIFMARKARAKNKKPVRMPIFMIEFVETKMVRAFDVEPDVLISNRGMFDCSGKTGYSKAALSYYPRECALMPSLMYKGKK